LWGGGGGGGGFTHTPEAATWRQVAQEGKAAANAPSPRSGHRAVLSEHNSRHFMVVFGGFFDNGREVRYYVSLSCACAHTHTHTRTFTQHTHTNICIHTHTHTRAFTHTPSHTHASHTHIHTHMHTHIPLKGHPHAHESLQVYLLHTHDSFCMFTTHT